MWQVEGFLSFNVHLVVSNNNFRKEMEGDGIEHRRVEVNGIKMHVAEKGKGPVVLLLHGFPELWYSWRHQIVGLSSLGYRVVAPDLRGFGDTDAPSSVSSYTMLHLVGDIVALINSLAVDRIFLVAHDWGAIIAWPRNPKMKPVDLMRAMITTEILTSAWTGAKVKVPVKFIIGDLDLVYTSLGMKDYIESAFKKDVPNLEQVVVQEGVGHFINQEAAEDVTNHIYHFINKYFHVTST
ncbi:hypothetical protein VNO78_18326 [Psophocarpus tetragonolobus]|uniref:AB hydrolase-1 domain-containing protein n=1 Tax=Psophocarpus tetragonolobus TaxID=3891 RepID=A0AAN9SKD4_PSOTE